MDWKTFIIEISDIFVWPVFIIGLIYLSKNKLNILIERVTKIKHKDTEINFTEIIGKVKRIDNSDKEELKDKTLDLVNKIRKFIEKWQEEDNEININKETNQIFTNSQNRNNEYNKLYKVDAIILRDELRERLNNIEIDKDRIDFTYEYPTNYFGFNDIANDLEKMAKLLK